MATTLHPNSVIGLFSVMSTPLLTFAVNGKVTYASVLNDAGAAGTAIQVFWSFDPRGRRAGRPGR